MNGREGLNDAADRRVFDRVGAEAFGGAWIVAATAGEMAIARMRAGSKDPKPFCRGAAVSWQVEHTPCSHLRLQPSLVKRRTLFTPEITAQHAQGVACRVQGAN